MIVGLTEGLFVTARRAALDPRGTGLSSRLLHLAPRLVLMWGDEIKA